MPGWVESFGIFCGIFIGIVGITVFCLTFRSASESSLLSWRRALRPLLYAIGVFAVLELLYGTSALFGNAIMGAAVGTAVEVAEIALVLCAAASFYLLKKDESHEVNQLRHLANFDHLTNLNNQSYFRREGPKWIADSKRHDQPLSCVMIDVDSFKDYNDRFGHEAGNTVLQAISRVLIKSCRTEDLAVRYGGEEFVLLVRGELSDATALAERIRMKIEYYCSPERNPRVMHDVTVSLGVASLTEQMTSLEELVTSADKKLYQAKREGKNTVRALEPFYAAKITSGQKQPYDRLPIAISHAGTDLSAGHRSSQTRTLASAQAKREHGLEISGAAEDTA